MQFLIQTPTGNLKESLSFYEKLNFKTLSQTPHLVSDGTAIIEINPDSSARAGVKIYQEDWSETVAKLQLLTHVVTIEGGYVLADPSNTWIYLIEGTFPEHEALPQENSGVLGNYAGLSLEVVDMEKAVAIWELLGLEKTMGDINQGWLALRYQKGFGVSLMKPNMCPHLCFNPSMTYFNGGKNLPVIQKIRDLAIPITEEITAFSKEGIADNIIIRDPGGYGFFVFND